MFSKNLSKNFIFDLLNCRKDYVYSQNVNSKFQYFDLSRLENFTENFNNDIINLVSEPVSISEILDTYKSKVYSSSNFNKSNLINYNVMTDNTSSGYYLSKNEVLKDLKAFFKNHE